MCDEHIDTRDPRAEPDSPFRYVDITSVDNTAKRILDAKTLVGREAPSRARQVVHTDDVLVSTTRPNLNSVAMVPSNLHGGICSTGFCVLRPKTFLSPTYLFLFVQSLEFVENVSSFVKGALYPAVTDRQVRAQFIPLPPLDEQERMAAVLKEQMAAVERARAATLAQLKAAKALPAAYLRAVFDSPEARKWPLKRVSELCSGIDYGFTASADFGMAEPRFLRITDIQDGHVGWHKVPGCQISPEEELAKTLADGDIVFARTGATTGKSFLVKQPPRAVFASYLIRLRPSSQVTAEYMYAFFQSDGYWQQVRASARGGAQPNVNATLLGSLTLPVPPLAEQQRIVARVNEQMAQAEKVRRELDDRLTAINALPAALLHRAFSGGL